MWIRDMTGQPAARPRPPLKEKIDGGEIRMVGAVYELDSGRLRWLSD
jgi:hypothetical protein